MNKRIAFFLYLLLIPVAAFAQKTDVINIASASQTFKLTFSDTGATRTENIRFSYQSDSEKYIVRMSAPADTFVCYGSLDLNAFKSQLSNIAVNNWSMKPISDYSAQQIFFWVYSRFSDDDSDDIAGTLLLRDEIMVLSKDVENKYYYEKRIAAVDSSSNDYSLKEADLNGKKELLRSAILVITDSLRLLSTGTPTVTSTYTKDTTNLVKYISTLKSAQSFNSGTINKVCSLIYNIITTDTTSINQGVSKFLIAGSSKIRTSDTVYTASQKEVDRAQAGLDTLGIYHIEDMSLQFEKGFLERVKVSVIIKGSPWTFENVFAIGFSSTSNFANLNMIRLYQRKTDDSHNRYIYLSDLFKNTYNNELANYTRDYSPGDTTLNHIDPSTTSFVTLYKSDNVNLFESKIYTDLNGLSENSPNGLLQTDVSRRFNINTVRHELTPHTDIGVMNYINIYGTLNKIENKQRYLSLHNQNVASNDSVISPSYATNLDFLRYRNGTLGFSVGAFLFDYPDGKFTIYLDFGGEYAHTPVINAHRVVDTPGIVTTLTDSMHLDANMGTLYPRLTFEIFSERKVGFKLSYQYNYTWLFSNNQYKQVMSYEKSNLTDFYTDIKSRQSSMLEFYLRAEVSQNHDNQVFFRARFYWQWGDVNTFFPQVQLGYNYNLIYKR